MLVSDATTEERSLADQILLAADPKKRQVVQADTAVDIFLGFGLGPDILATIWDLADEGKGYLDREGVLTVLRLVGWAQNGVSITAELVNKAGPVPVFHHAPTPPSNASTPSPALPTPGSPSTSKLKLESHLNFPPLSVEEKARYQILFRQSSPQNGILSGSKVWQIFSRYNAPVEAVSDIWNLVDHHERGDLNMAEFTLAMYLVHGILDGRFKTIPPTLPSWLLEQVGTKPKIPQPSKVDLDAAFNADFSTLHSSLDLGAMSSLPPEVAEVASRYFDALVQGESEVLNGEAVANFLNRSKFPPDILSEVWMLADTEQKGCLDRRGFATALFLVYQRLARSQRRRPDVRRSLTVPPPARPPSSPSKDKALDDHSQQDYAAEMMKLKQENRRLRSQSMSEIQDTSRLEKEVQRLQATLVTVQEENDALRLTVEEATKDPFASSSAVTEEMVLVELLKELEEKDKALSHLSDVTQERDTLMGENELLRTQLDHLKTELRNIQRDVEVAQNVAIEELSEENAKLRLELSEVRAGDVPSARDDLDLQDTINQELSRENRALREKLSDHQETINQLQGAASRTAEVEQLLRDVQSQNRVLSTEILALNEQKAALTQRVEDMNMEVRRLKHRLRRNARPQQTDIDPPAYEETPM